MGLAIPGEEVHLLQLTQGIEDPAASRIRPRNDDRIPHGCHAATTGTRQAGTCPIYNQTHRGLKRLFMFCYYLGVLFLEILVLEPQCPTQHIVGSPYFKLRQHMHELNHSTHPSTRPMLFIAMAIYYVGMSINCMLTPSPYASHHGGKLGREVESTTTVFFISPAYITLGAEAVTVLIIISQQRPMMIQRKLQDSQACMIFCFSLLMLLSGILNTIIFTHPLTYAYNCISIWMASLIATHDSMYSSISKADLRGLGWIWGGLALAGLGLCIFLPFRYGYLPFEFSRTSRGEITYWMLLDLYLLIPVLCGLSFWYRLSGRWLIAALSAIVIVACLSTVTRSVIVITFAPLLCVMILSLLTSRFSLLKHSLILIFLLCGVAILIVAVTGTGFASPEDTISLEASRNQRFELWQFHWDNFVRDPIFGAGPFSLSRNTLTITDSQASCEIGALIWFSEYGVFTGAIVLLWVIKAFYRGTCCLIDRRGNVEIGYLFCVLVFASLVIIFLFEDLSRILDWLSFLFWYSMFYLNYSAGTEDRTTHRELQAPRQISSQCESGGVLARPLLLLN